jgi:hypothetical protein
MRELQQATLGDPTEGLACKGLKRLHNPLHGEPSASVNEDTWLAIDLYLGTPSEAMYETVHVAILRHWPSTDLPSYYRAKCLVADLSGVESIVHDMCVNSCVAFTRPFLELESCPMCSEPRYDQFRIQMSDRKDRAPCQEFHTIPIGPQIQVLYHAPETATHAHYLHEERSRVLSEIQSNGCLSEYSDVLHGTDLINAFEDGCIEEDDIVLMFSIDGAQLYAKKASVCWIYIWVLFNLPLSLCYRKSFVFIGGFIPGPNNPRNIDSFLLPGLHHLVSLQKEGLQIWDGTLKRELQSKVFLALLTADGPGMMHITGLVGYHGKHGCRLYCGLAGRHEEHGKHYFPAILKPTNYNVEGCAYDDIDIKNLPTPSHE